MKSTLFRAEQLLRNFVERSQLLLQFYCRPLENARIKSKLRAGEQKLRDNQRILHMENTLPVALFQKAEKGYPRQSRLG
jgi:hypothetical protein